MKLPVIIATWNRLELFKQTLDTLRKNSDSDLQIIVVDSGSTDGTIKYLHKQRGLLYYRFEKRQIVGKTKNTGAKLAPPSDYIYFSDDDVYFEPHWDTALISALEKYDDIGIVGGKKHPQHAVLTTRPWNNHYVHIVRNQAGYSLMLRQADFKALGGFAEDKTIKHGGEDTKLCTDCFQMGKLVATIEPPVVRHCGMTCYNGRPASDIKEMLKLQLERPEIIFA